MLLFLPGLPFFAYGGEPATESKNQPSRLAQVVDFIRGKIKPRVWLDQKPPPYFYSNPLPSFWELQDKTVVHPLNIREAFKEMFVLRDGLVRLSDHYSHPIDIYQNSYLETTLLADSFTHGGGESARVLALGKEGQILAISEGYTTRSSSYPEYLMAGQFNQIGRTPGLFLIDMVHTHPSYEFSYETPGYKKAHRISTLSYEDIELTQRYSLQNPNVYIRIRAVVANGYNYSLTFFNGRVVHDPVYLKSNLGKDTKLFFIKNVYPQVQ